MFATILIRLKINNLTSDEEETLIVFNFGFLIIMLIIFCTFLTICLKLELGLSITWNGCFWPIWIMFAINIGINFAFFLVLLNRLCAKQLEGADKWDESINYFISHWVVLDFLYFFRIFLLHLSVYKLNGSNLRKKLICLDVDNFNIYGS